MWTYDVSQVNKSFFRFKNKKTAHFFVLVAVIPSFFGICFGIAGGGAAYYILSRYGSEVLPKQQNVGQQTYVPQTTQEQKIIDTVKKASPSVVSIIITKDVPILEQSFTNPFEEFFGPHSPFQFQIPKIQQKGTQKQEIGGGSGFIVSEDGMIVTNKHVVLDKEAEYTVFTNDGKSYPAKVLARDPVQDLAILKISQEGIVDQAGGFLKKPFIPLVLGDSKSLEIGQSVIAIGNALGEFRNAVSVGVVSGLQRTVTASDGNNFQETIEDVIQTDAAINPGNSGGPLLNLAGEVIGINTATVLQAQSIGFAIPVDRVKKDIEQTRLAGKIVYPYLGVRYGLVTEKLKKEQGLSVDYGAFINKGPNGEPALPEGSPAAKAGVKEGDVILKVNGENITTINSLGKIIQKYNPGDEATLTIMRDKKEITLSVVLGERSE